MRLASAALGAAALWGASADNAAAQSLFNILGFGDNVTIQDGEGTEKRKRPLPSLEDARSIRSSYIKAGRPYVRHKDDKGRISVSFPTGFGDISGALDTMGEQWGAADKGKFEAAMKAKGVRLGNPMMLQIFKVSDKGDTGHVALWMKPEGQEKYVHVIDMPMCLFSGELGPKTAQGDLQMPEGHFVITPSSNRGSAKYTWSVDVGFNSSHVYVKRHGLSGSAIMVHGKCKSVGCAALGDTYIKWVQSAVNAAMRHGQTRIQVQMMPFAMTEENLKAHASSPHARYWREELKPAYDRFMQTRVPEDVAVCGLGRKARYTLKDQVKGGQSCVTVDGQSLEPAAAEERIVVELPVIKPVEPVLSQFVIDGRVLTMPEFQQFQRCVTGTAKAGETCAIEPTKIFACATANADSTQSYSLWTEAKVSTTPNCVRVEAAQFKFE